MAIDAVAAFKALADGNRLRVVVLLGEQGESCACDLLEGLGISQPTLSHHMRVLQEAGLVRCRRQGKWCHYSLERGSVKELASFFSSLAEGDGSSSEAGCSTC